MPGLLILLAVGLALAWLWGVLWTVRLLAQPPRRSFAWAVARSQPSDPSEAEPSREFESFEFRNPAGGTNLAAWSIAGEDPHGPVVIFSHGWGESRQAVLRRLDAIAPLCSRVLAWDLPGHGESGGRCALGTREWLALDDLIDLAQGVDPEARERQIASIEAEQEDEADWDEILDDAPAPGAPPVVLMGFSLGAGICLLSARSRSKRVACVIAEAPYRLAPTPARNVLRIRRLPHRATLPPAMAWLGVRLLGSPTWNGFDRAEIAQEVKCPVLVLHGVADEICPHTDGTAIARAAPRGELALISAASHNTMWAQGPGRAEAIAAVHSLLRGVRRGTATAEPALDRIPDADG